MKAGKLRSSSCEMVSGGRWTLQAGLDEGRVNVDIATVCMEQMWYRIREYAAFGIVLDRDSVKMFLI